MSTTPPTLEARLRGLLIGTAVGDALGLPTEGLSPSRARRLFPGAWRHRLFFGRGLVSDDTEHTLFVAQALLAEPTAPDRFACRLARSLRWWLVALPAGVGLATLRAILRLWIGISPTRSGVRSAGNGAAMRSAVIGAFFAGSPDQRARYSEAATDITHRDPRALAGARAVAELAGWAVREGRSSPPSPAELRQILEGCGDDPEWRAAVDRTVEAVAEERSVEEFARILGLEEGVSGYVLHTVPIAVHAWHRHYGDFRATLESVLDRGGDTDTVGAIAGALAGVTVGIDAIPNEWIEPIREWPRGTRLLERVASRLAKSSGGGEAQRPVAYCWPAVPLRNALFLAVVLAHGFRRLAPPY